MQRRLARGLRAMGLRRCTVGVLGSVAAAAMLMQMSSASLAADIAVADTTGVTEYTATLNGLIAAFRSESARALEAVNQDASSRNHFYNPIQERNLLYGPSNMTVEETQWAKANLRIYDIYEALGGNPIDLDQNYRHNQGRYFVSLSTVGGDWFDSTTDASGYMLKLLISRSVDLPNDVKDAVAALESDDLDDVLAQAREAMIATRSIIATDTESAITITGSGFSNATGTPVVEGGTGIDVVNVVLESDKTLTATIRVNDKAPLGNVQLAVFNAGTTLKPVDTGHLFIVAGDNSGLTALEDDHGSSLSVATLLTPGATVNGRIDGDDDEDLFAISVPAAGTLTVQSSGGTDLSAVLENAAGTILAENDDAGNWYNFSLSAAANPGVVYVRVRHCCAGTGEYSLSASLN